MKKNNIAVILILAVSAVLFTLGVIKKIQHMTSGASKSGNIIAVIPKGTASMWWEVVRSGAEQAGKEEGYTISWNGPEQENDREKQIQSVEDALTHGIKALVLGPNDSKALVRPVEKAKGTGIPVVIIDSSIETDQYDSFAATDNVAGGADAARRLGAALNGHGKVILTCFIQNSASTDDRARGFKETLAKEFPGIELIAEQYTLGTVEDARQKTVDMLTKHSDTDGVFAVNQPVSVGAYKALQTQGLTGKVKFVGFDSDPVLLEGIEKGEVDSLIVQNPFEIGYSGVKTAVAILQGKQVEKLKPIPSMIVDKSNLDEMKAKFPAALGLTSGKPKDKAQTGKTIAVIPKGTASMWWEVVRKGAEKAGEEEGYKISWNGPEQENDREKQIQSVEDSLTRGAVALVLGPNDAKALVRPVEKAKASGIPVVIIDSSLETDKYDSFAATDNVAGGADAARRLGAALNGHGKVILTCFIQNSASTDDRAKGFKETLAKEFPGIELVAEQYTLGTVEDARQKTVDMLTKHNDIDGLFAVNQPTSVGAYKALQSQKLTGKVKFVGFDSDPVLLEGIEKGEVDSLIVQDPYKIGYTGVKTAVDILDGKKVEKLKPIPSMIVDKNNLEEQKKENPAALGL
ncbi:MAG: substrate-binding domain-containing protein [Lentisphaeria bacterium]|nr:substrate-binding domain-containing protein [Lentisphaeria bacterium]